MAENYKLMYEQMKAMVAKYQDEVVPELRDRIVELEQDNTRLRDMWAKAVVDLGTEKTNTKHAHWIYKPFEGDDTIWLYHCSICDTPNARERNYCNNCGAIMDGETVGKRDQDNFV